MGFKKYSSNILFSGIIVGGLFSSFFINSFATSNLIENSSFEDITKSLPLLWNEEKYVKDSDVTLLKIDKTDSHLGKNSVSIENTRPNDARLIQKVPIVKNKNYKISCYVKTQNIGQNSKGANISVSGQIQTSKDLKGTVNTWTYLEMYIQNKSDTPNVLVSFGIGGYGSMNTGKAWFDDFVVEEVESIGNPEFLLKLETPQVVGTQKNMNNNTTSNTSANSNNNLIVGLSIVISIGIIGTFLYKKYSYKEENIIETQETINNQKDLI